MSLDGLWSQRAFKLVQQVQVALIAISTDAFHSRLTWSCWLCSALKVALNSKQTSFFHTLSKWKLLFMGIWKLCGWNLFLPFLVLWEVVPNWEPVVFALTRTVCSVQVLICEHAVGNILSALSERSQTADQCGISMRPTSVTRLWV